MFFILCVDFKCIYSADICLQLPNGHYVFITTDCSIIAFLLAKKFKPSKDLLKKDRYCNLKGLSKLFFFGVLKEYGCLLLYYNIILYGVNAGCFKLLLSLLILAGPLPHGKLENIDIFLNVS